MLPMNSFTTLLSELFVSTDVGRVCESTCDTTEDEVALSCRGAGDLPRASTGETFLTFAGDGGGGGVLGECPSGGAFGVVLTGFGGGGGISTTFAFGSACPPFGSRFKLSICLAFCKVSLVYLGGRGCDVDA